MLAAVLVGFPAGNLASLHVATTDVDREGGRRGGVEAKEAQESLRVRVELGVVSVNENKSQLEAPG